MVPTSVFITNRRGYPTLSRRHQEFLSDCFRRGVQVVLAGNPHHTPGGPTAPSPPPPPPLPVPPGPGGEAVPAGASSHPLQAHWEYLSYLFRKLEATLEQVGRPPPG